MTRPATALDAASAYLRIALAEIARSERDLRRESQAHGISEKTLRRAKRHLGVKSQRQGKSWLWLPLRQDGQEQDAHHGEGGQNRQRGQNDLDQSQRGHHEQGGHVEQDRQSQHGQEQDTQTQPGQNPKPFVGADGRLYTVTLAQCRRCSGTNWGPSGRHTPDGVEIWTCLDCLRPSPETPPAPCASNRAEGACPSCHDLYSVVKDTRSKTCLRCHRRF